MLLIVLPLFSKWTICFCEDVVRPLSAYVLKEKHEAQLSNVTIKNLTMGCSVTFLLAWHFCFSEKNSENTIDE